MDQYQCGACGWVHVAIPLADAQAHVRDANEYAAQQGLSANATLAHYRTCFRCGADNAGFVPILGKDVPAGVTLQATVLRSLTPLA